MKTEINGDWKGYLKRFKLPSRKVLLEPLKYFAICLVVQVVFCVLASVTHILLLVVSSLIVGAFLYSAFKILGEVVLEEAKGFWADTLMWFYYLVLVLLTVVAPFLIAYPYLN